MCCLLLQLLPPLLLLLNRLLPADNMGNLDSRRQESSIQPTDHTTDQFKKWGWRGAYGVQQVAKTLQII